MHYHWGSEGKLQVGLWVAAAGRAAVVSWGDGMGPERTFPTQSEERGPHQSPAEGLGVRAASSLGKNKRKKEVGGGPAGSSPQPRCWARGGRAGTVAGREDGAADAQNRMQVPGLHRPDPPWRARTEMEREQQHSTEQPRLCSRGPRTRWAGVRGKGWWSRIPSGKIRDRRPSRPRRHPLPGNDHTERGVISLHYRPEAAEEWTHARLECPCPSSRLPFHIKMNQASQKPTHSVLCVWRYQPKPNLSWHVSLWGE